MNAICRCLPRSPVSRQIEQPFDFPDPLGPPEELDGPSDLDELDFPSTDEADWEAFLADDDERDPLPEQGDFWVDGAD